MSAPESGSFEFFGERFTLRPADEYQWAMLEFAEVATGGVEDSTMEALAAVMAMLRASIVEEDFDRFRKAARANRAQVRRDLMPVVVAAFRQEVPDRPTGRSSDSSDGPSTTQPSSGGDSPSLAVVHRLEAKGRPDLALMVELADEARAASAV